MGKHNTFFNIKIQKTQMVALLEKKISSFFIVHYAL
jgi:hypothetical protein